MATDEAYPTAEKRIAEAHHSGATELNLSGLGLTELPESLGELSRLQALDLSRNALTALPEWLGQLTQLQTLKTSYCELKEVPDSLGQLKRLETLNLDGGQLTAVPECVGKLTQLQKLNLTGNRITALPEWLGQLTQLKTVTFQNNAITDLPKAFVKLKQLRYLNISGNRLNSIPDFLSQLSDLRSLDLSANKFKSLTSISRLTQIRTLRLNNNELDRLPDEFRHLTNLVELDFGSGWGPATNNRFTEIPSTVFHLKNLRSLKLDFNPISFVSSQIGALRNLVELSFEYRSLISDLPVEISQLRNLTDLRLNRESLNPELAAAYDQGLDAVKAYLRAKAEEQIVLHEAKLILIGEGAVGKSCLLDALREVPWRKHERTHGIRLEPVELANPESGEMMTLNGWDFGGQRVYRPTHQLFFSSPAVYLVVWKPREGQQAGQVSEWIKLIKHREPDAKVLVVATHGGPKQTQPDVDEFELTSQFGRDTVLGFHKVDSLPIDYDEKNKETWANARPCIPELRDAIAQVAADLPEMGRTVPAKWQQVREQLDNAAQSWMYWSDFVAFCAGYGMDEQQVDLFAKLSHTLGHLVHYDYDSQLRDIVILKPDWLATAISFVLDDGETRRKHGLVSYERLCQLWNDPEREPDQRYPEELHATFRRLMERFDLSYPVVLDASRASEPDTCLIAQLVDDVRPEFPGWEDELDDGDFEQQQICRIIDDRNESAEAEGLFYQLIVRLHKYSLGRASHADSVHWKRGLMLDDDYNGRALLEHIGNNVRITVRAAYPGHFLSVLTEHISSLVESFWEGLNCEIMVPCLEDCRRDNNPAGLLSVRKLIDSKKKGRHEHPCPICNEWQEIDRLLTNSPVSVSADAIADASFDDVMAELSAIREELGTLGRQELNRFRALNNLQRRRISQVDEQFERLMSTLTDEAKDGPRLFSLEPRKPDGLIERLRTTGKELYRLTLWCEHSRLPLTALNGKGEPDGFYDIEIPNEWLVGAASFLSKLNTTLSLVLPVAASGAKMLLADADYQLIGERLESNKSMISSLVQHGDTIGSLMATGTPNAGRLDVDGGREGINADGSLLRQLHTFLEQQDPAKEFGGLVKVPKKSGGFLWVHPKYTKEY